MNGQDDTTDLRTLLKVLAGHIIPIAAITILSAAAGFVLAGFAVPEHYTSEAVMYVENSSVKENDPSVDINGINAAQKLADTCKILFTSNRVFGELNARFGGIYTDEHLKKMIKIESVINSGVLRFSVETTDPQESRKVAVELVDIAVNEFSRVIKGGSIETVSAPTLPEKHNYADTVCFTAIAALTGAAGSYLIFLMKEMFDTKIKPTDDLAQIYEIPVFAGIPDFETAGKASSRHGKYGVYSYGREDDMFGEEGSGLPEKK